MNARVESRINPKCLTGAAGTGSSDGRREELICGGKTIKSSILSLLCWIYCRTFKMKLE